MRYSVYGNQVTVGHRADPRTVARVPEMLACGMHVMCEDHDMSPVVIIITDLEPADGITQEFTVSAIVAHGYDTRARDMGSTVIRELCAARLGLL